MISRRPRRLRSGPFRALLVAVSLATALLPSANLRPVAADAADQALVWNQHATNELIVTRRQAPPVSVLHLAMMHGAVYDAVNAISGTHEPLLVRPAAGASDSKEAAAASAAYRVLRHLLADRAAHLASLYEASLATIADGAPKARGIVVGEAAAAAMIAARTGDGRFGNGAFTVGSGVGQWRPLALGLPGNNFRWIGEVKPFVIDDAARFATSGPLELASAEYAAEFDEVKALGRATGSTRSADQTEQAQFWADHTTASWTPGIFVGRSAVLALTSRGTSLKVAAPSHHHQV